MRARLKVPLAQPESLHVHLAGAVVAAAYGVMAIGSWFLWPVRTAGPAAVGGYAALLAVCTGLTCQLLWRAAQEPVHQSHVTTAWRWTLVLILIALFTYPPLSGDLRYYLVAGRTFARGGNVYGDLLSLPDAQGIFLQPYYYQVRFPYGPLWLWLSAGMAAIGQRHVLLELFLMKALIATAYAVSVAVVRSLVRSEPPRKQLAALLIAGWLPAGVHVIVGDGHNDAMMMALALLGLRALSRSTKLSGIWLVGSVLVKYVTAPLLVLAAWQYWRKREWRRLALLGALCTLTAIILVPILQSPEARGAFQTDWQFYSPAHLFTWAIPDPMLAGVALWLFRALLAAWFVQTWRSDTERAHSVPWHLLSVGSCCVLLGAGYLWPWYLWWSLPLVAVSEGASELRVLLPLAVLLPFVDVVWHISGDYPWRGTILLYAGAVAGFFVMWAAQRLAHGTTLDPTTA